MKFFTMILKVPDDWRPGPELMDNPYFTAGSWSHVIDDRNKAMAEVEQLKLRIQQLEGEKHGT